MALHRAGQVCLPADVAKYADALLETAPPPTPEQLASLKVLLAPASAKAA